MIAHVWLVDLDRVEPRLDWLDPREQQRANRFRFVDAHRQFVHSHTALRFVLGQALATDPALVAIDAPEHEKPRLAEPGLHFNLAHAGDLALVGWSRDGEIGVDIERVRPETRWRRIAENYFAPEEIASLGSADQFFALWTRKEAYLKARGAGIAQGLRTMDWAGWSVETWVPRSGYFASVAMAGPMQLEHHHYPG